MLSDAASQARAAAGADNTWQQLAADMEQIAGLPETGNTPQQESEFTQDDRQVVRICASLTGPS